MKVWAGLGKNGSSRRKRKTNITTISICIHISSLNLVCIHIYGILLMSFTFFRFSLHRQNGPAISLWLYFSSLFTYLSFFFPPFFNFWLGFHDVLLTFLNNISFFLLLLLLLLFDGKTAWKRCREIETQILLLFSFLLDDDDMSPLILCEIRQIQ